MKTLLVNSLVVAGFCLIAGTSLAETVWVDVRTVEEYQQDHIEGDLNLPLHTLEDRSLASRFDQDDEIMLYCRSGGRAEQALEIFEAAGFGNVHNAGGIEDAREMREQEASDG